MVKQVCNIAGIKISLGSLQLQTFLEILLFYLIFGIYISIRY